VILLSQAIISKFKPIFYTLFEAEEMRLLKVLAYQLAPLKKGAVMNSIPMCSRFNKMLKICISD